ncbi:MAG: trigger factor, partial [Selenomonadaceae bacterium]|nr:trigger factor [Selenomonadaceae bacterium]
ILEQHVGKDAIINEASETLLQNATRKALGILNLVPVSENKADVITNEEGKDFVFTLTFVPFPQAKLGEYKNLEAEKVVEPVTDEDVDKQVEAMRAHHANLIDAAEGDAIVDGDFITLDYTGTVDGEKFSGGEAKDAPLEIGAHKFIGDFEEQLIGAKVGEERTVKVTFPENYHAKDLAGKDAEFACKINSIKHRELPALDDEFVKKVSTFQTVDEYKADIRKNMEANAERRAVEAQRQAVIDKAVENMTVDLPPVMIDNRVTQMINELDAQLQSSGMNLQQYMAFSGMDMDKLREEYRENAKKAVLTEIMLERVAQAEKLTVTQGELNFEISMMAQMYRTPQKQIEKYLKDSGQISGVAAGILRRKASKFIIDNMAGAKVEPPAEAAEETKDKEETKEN